MIELIVDGNGLVCRLWWAKASNVPERFKRAIDDVKRGDCLVRVAWDSPPSWRLDLLPAYKAHRGPKPQALFDALRSCRGIFEDCEAPGFEADDVIGTECAAALARGAFVIVMSDDKDMATLVGPRCLWLAGGKIHNEGAVLARFGVPPNRLRHFLSWMGDKTDGLPGVPGYGPKKAAAMALAGKIGNQLTYDLTELATVPGELMRRAT